MNEPKLSLVENIFLIMAAIIGDIANAVPGLNFIATVITLMVFQGYFRFKGVRGIYSLVGNLIEFIPVISILPALTAGVVTTIIIDHWPAAQKVAEKAATKISSKGGLTGNITQIPRPQVTPAESLRKAA